MNTSKVTQAYRLSQWTQIIEDRMSEGTSIKAFCAERGISKNTYFYWLRKVRETACEQLAVRQDGTAVRSNQYRFAEIRVEQPSSFCRTSATETICLEYNGVSVSIKDNYPPEKVAVIIRELVRS